MTKTISALKCQLNEDRFLWSVTIQSIFCLCSGIYACKISGILVGSLTATYWFYLDTQSLRSEEALTHHAAACLPACLILRPICVFTCHTCPEVYKKLFFHSQLNWAWNFNYLYQTRGVHVAYVLAFNSNARQYVIHVGIKLMTLIKTSHAPAGSYLH